MSQKRTQKLKKQRAIQSRELEQARQKLARFMCDRDVYDLYKAMPGRIRNFMVEYADYPPKIVAQPGVPATTTTALQEWFQSKLTGDFTIADFYSHIVPLLTTSRSITRHAAITALMKPMQKIHTAITNRLTDALISTSLRPLPDKIRYSSDMEFVGTNYARQRFVITIKAIEPTIKHIRLDGKYRPTYQLILPLGVKPSNSDKLIITDLSPVQPTAALIDPKRFGIPAQKPLPVYFQAHALIKLRERLNVPGLQTVLMSMLFHAFADPKPIAQNNGLSFLIPIHVRSRQLGMPVKVGYLVAEPNLNGLVIRTFKFITMDGTPEAECLWSTLKISRPDIDYYHLDKLGTLVNSDLVDRADLRAVLGGCGLESIFRLVDFMREPGATFKLADELAKHINMKPRQE